MVRIVTPGLTVSPRSRALKTTVPDSGLLMMVSASFAWLHAEADRFARALIADGMQAGERIGLWAPNSREWVAAAVGAQRAGGTLVPLNTRLRIAEASDILARANVTRIVTVGSLREVDYPALLREAGLPELRRVIVLPPAASPHWPRITCSGR